jgi:hypothetical protein
LHPMSHVTTSNNDFASHVARRTDRRQRRTEVMTSKSISRRDGAVSSDSICQPIWCPSIAASGWIACFSPITASQHDLETKQLWSTQRNIGEIYEKPCHSDVAYSGCLSG